MQIDILTAPNNMVATENQNDVSNKRENTKHKSSRS